MTEHSEINVGDFVMVPTMGCTIYKVTEIITTDRGKQRFISKTPMKIMPNSKIKDLEFTSNDFSEKEVVKIKNW